MPFQTISLDHGVTSQDDLCPHTFQREHDFHSNIVVHQHTHIQLQQDPIDSISSIYSITIHEFTSGARQGQRPLILWTEPDVRKKANPYLPNDTRICLASS